MEPNGIATEERNHPYPPELNPNQSGNYPAPPDGTPPENIITEGRDRPHPQFNPDQAGNFPPPDGNYPAPPDGNYPPPPDGNYPAPPDGMPPEMRDRLPNGQPGQPPNGAPPDFRHPRNLPPPNHPLDHPEGMIPTDEHPADSPVNQSGEQTGEQAPPPHPEEGTALANVWIYEGEAYDLTDFITQHPGGAFFIGRMKNRDITTIVNIFHPNPEKAKRRLQKYALGRRARPEDIHPKYNAPAFLFKKEFDGWKDTPRYNFQNKDQLLNRVKNRLKDPEIQKKIAQMDRLFNGVCWLLAVAYVAIQALRLNLPEFMPMYVFVPLMAMIRISLSGAGHYMIHRPQVGWNKIFSNIFDLNYVPMAFVVTDGHSLMHHPFTQSDVDIKRNVFTAMLELPRWYRVPIHTLHKLGHVCIGMFIRSFELCSIAIKLGVQDMYGTWQLALPHYIGLIAMRVLLLGELILFAVKGDFWAWFAQFVVTIWISTFMIVASHDFEEEEAPERDDQQDWAVAQIKNSYDLTMIGNKYIDCFLSAGLSPHRVHHVLPYQKSGFANIVSEDLVREEAAKFDLPWYQPKNFFIDRLPSMASHYLFVPSRWAKENHAGLLKEHFHIEAFKTTADYLYKGFQGIGSI